jgi:hypothetical protein
MMHLFPSVAGVYRIDTVDPLWTVFVNVPASSEFWQDPWSALMDHEYFIIDAASSVNDADMVVLVPS